MKTNFVGLPGKVLRLIYEIERSGGYIEMFCVLHD